MTLTDSKKIKAKRDKLCTVKEHQQLILTPEKSFVSLFNSKNEITTEEFCVACSEWIYCRHDGFFQSSKPEFSDPIALADITKTKMLICASKDKVFYVSPNNPPENGEFFVSLFATHRLVSFSCYDFWTETPLTLTLPAKDYQKLIGLTLNFLKAHHSQWYKLFLQSYYPELVQAHIQQKNQSAPPDEKQETQTNQSEGEG